MHMRMPCLAALLVGAAFSHHGLAGETPELKISDVLRELVPPLKEKSGYQISIEGASFGIRGFSTDPGAYLRVISDIPLFKNPEWIGLLPQQEPADEPRSFSIKAEITRPSAADIGAHSDQAGASVVLATAKAIFGEARCTLVSELETKTGAAMFRWRCPTDLQGVADLVSELEAERIHIQEFAVFQNTILKDQASMDMRFTGIAIPAS